MLGQVFEVFGDVLLVFWRIDSQVMHTMTRRLKHALKVTHSGKNSDHLLGVMHHVIGLTTHLHQHVNHRRVDRLKPRVHRVELVTQNQPQGLHLCICAHVSASQRLVQARLRQALRRRHRFAVHYTAWSSNALPPNRAPTFCAN